MVLFALVEAHSMSISIRRIIDWALWIVIFVIANGFLKALMSRGLFLAKFVPLFMLCWFGLELFAGCDASSGHSWELEIALLGSIRCQPALESISVGPARPVLRTVRELHREFAVVNGSQFHYAF